jgi:hypothetical protein
MDRILSMAFVVKAPSTRRGAQAQSGIAKQPPKVAMPPGIVLDGAEHRATIKKPSDEPGSLPPSRPNRAIKLYQPQRATSTHRLESQRDTSDSDSVSVSISDSDPDPGSDSDSDSGSAMAFVEDDADAGEAGMMGVSACRGGRR